MTYRPLEEDAVVVQGTRRNDVLFGSLGQTVFYGKEGDDVFYVRTREDRIIEEAGGGNDSVFSSVTYTTPINVENLTLTGTDNIYGFGNNSNNILTGNIGHNRLSGGRGNDVLYGMAGKDLLLGGDGDDHLDGGTGADYMKGGSGNDVYIVDDEKDTVIEEAYGGSDTVISSVSYTASAHIENLTLTGSGHISATGNSGSNVLTGNSGNNRLDGGAGADRMAGGSGDDVYIVDNVNDTVIEDAYGGSDSIISSVTYTAPINVENLTLTGTGNTYGFGNNSNNILTGNSGHNRLIAGRGNDVLYGMDGNDLLLGGDGTDLLDGGSGNDILRGDAGNDTLDGGTGNDILEGGSGRDVYLFGRGYGNDTIRDSDGLSTIRFGSGIRTEDIDIAVKNNAWELKLKNSSDSLTVDFQNGQTVSDAVARFEFSDGRSYSAYQMLARSGIVPSENEQMTRIAFKDGRTAAVISGKGQDFQTASLKWVESADWPRKVPSEYLRDSDGDGLIDAVDRRPDQWDVSERDLRMFTSLAYENGSTLASVFKPSWYGSNYSWYGNSTLSNQINQKYFLNNADVSELTGKWSLLKSASHSSGLDYSVFGNKNADGGYENIVVSFRGTEKTSIKDIWSDLKIWAGNMPSQVSHLTEIAKYVASFAPKNVYSAGHSLGGYLAEWFGSTTMQQNTTWSEMFKRSSLFNPAVIHTDGGSSYSVRSARWNADDAARTAVKDNSDITQSRSLYKSNSYVIKGEWVSDGFSVSTSVKTGAAIGAVAGGLIAGLLSGGLGFLGGALLGGLGGAATGTVVSQVHPGFGTYANANLLDFKVGEKWGKHNMTSFYETDSRLQKYFSVGTRIDKNYGDYDKDGLTLAEETKAGTNAYLRDTDGDGFSDGLEVKLKSDPADREDLQLDKPSLVAVVQTEDTGGNIVSVKEIAMPSEKTDSEIVYSPSGFERKIEADTFDWSAFENRPAERGTAVIEGTSGNDTIIGSRGSDTIWGGMGRDTIIGGQGRDTFVFKASDVKSGAVDTLADFNAYEDKLDLTGLRPLLGNEKGTLTFSDLIDTGVRLFDYPHLSVDKAADTLAYKTNAADTGTVFLKMDDDQIGALNAGNVLV